MSQKFDLPKVILEIASKFNKANYQLYLVGGAVRDLLLEKEVKDWDFTTDAKPEEILKIIPDGFYNNKFGTVGINSDLGILEVTTMRKEGDYKDHRHPTEVGWTNKIEEDLARRDFTINAIALNVIANGVKQSLEIATSTTSPRNDELIDPFGGQTDLENKLVKAVRDPNKRFREDALRLMRAIRIAAQLEFNIEQQTLTAIKTNSSLIEEIAWERIRDELFKLLASTDPYSGIILLRESGILKEILPELERNFGIVQEGPKHDRIYEIGEHSLLTLKHTPSIDPLVRFAALLHDIGKADTFKKDEGGNVTFYNHEVVGSQIILKIAKRFNLSKSQTDKVFKLVRFHMFTVDEHQTDSAVRRFIRNIGLENVDDLMALRIGDRLGGGTENEVSWRMKRFRERIDEVLKKPFSVTDLKVNGKEVMETLNIKPSPKVGEILQKLFEEVSEDSSKNTKEYLLKQIKLMS